MGKKTKKSTEKKGMDRKISSVRFKKATDGKYKYVACFYNKSRKLVKSTRFGAKGYSDFTKHKTPARKQKYVTRHKSRENWSKSGMTSAGALSRWILWNKPTMKESIQNYKSRFNLK